MPGSGAARGRQPARSRVVLVAGALVLLLVAAAALWIVPSWLDAATAQVSARLTTGSRHTCVLTASGGVRCWGDNAQGQLGDATTLTRSRPVTVQGMEGATALASGAGDHTCALAHGAVWCWGLNDRGQLGDGTLTSSSIPVQVTGVTDAVGVAAGASHSCALLASGAVRCWGANGVGELGDGSRDDSATPVDVVGLPTAMNALTTFGSSTCALTSRGRVQCWGDNSDAQLGTGTTEAALSARPARALGPRVRSVAAGDTHACAVTLTGGLLCWGANDAGQLGDGSRTLRVLPVEVPGQGGVGSVITGSQRTCTIRGGSVTCWGDGPGGGPDGADQRPMVASGAREVAVGGAHACAVVDQGVLCWGSNQSGQLGDGSGADSAEPVRVADL